MELVLSSRAAAKLIISLSKEALTPIALAAAKKERRMKSLFISAVQDAKDSVSLEKLEKSIGFGISIDAPLAAMEKPIAMLVSKLSSEPVKVKTYNYGRFSAEHDSLSGVLGQTLTAGANASEVCVVDPVLSAKKLTATKTQILDVWKLHQLGIKPAQIATSQSIAMTEEQVKWVITKIKTQVPQMIKVLGADNPLASIGVKTMTKSTVTGTVTAPPRAVGQWPISEATPRVLGSKYPVEVSRAFESWRFNLTSAEHEALKEYTGSTYMQINGYLRGKNDSQGTLRLVKDIESALAKAPKPPPPELVWRGSSSQGAREFAEKLASGDIIDLKGFQSTSINPQFAEHWGQGNVVFEIKPSAGAYIRDLSYHEREYEYLLPHGAKYRVVGRTEIKIGPYNKRTVIQLEML